ncbi:TonB-dependent receptor domain-containing protein [Spirosoma knui]
MKRFHPLLLSALLLLSGTAMAQTTQVSGTIADQKNETLPGVPIILTNQQDTTKQFYALTDINGRFTLNNVPEQQSYRLKATYLGFQDLVKTVEVNKPMLDLGTLQLIETARNLQEVNVVGRIAATTQKGDTTQFNADAYKVNKDASAEDLIQKLPGVSVVNGKVQSQGEDVQKVLVDGKPFFGDDPTIALRNLPAEVIQKIEVFDQLSDQSQFTGFNDGNTSKTINIVTRPDRRNGTFGRAYAGYGTSDTYSAGGNINVFNQDQRLSIVGLSNNINQQNFSAQDLVGASSGGGQRRGGSGGGGRGGGGNRGGGGGAPQSGGNNGASNFLVGQQGGINTANSLGINFSDDWGKKLTFRGSYFGNLGNNRNDQSLLRTYFLGGNGNQLYRENELSGSQNINHRLDFRLNYKINENNSLLFTPRLSYQNNSATSNLLGSTFLRTIPPVGETPAGFSDTIDSLLSRTQSDYEAARTGLNFNNNILFRHRFDKPGRTLSINLGTTVSDRDGLSMLSSLNTFMTVPADTQSIRQQTTSRTNGYELSGNVAYTEPLSKQSQLQLNYNISYNNNDADRRTFQYNALTGQYEQLAPQLSNVSQSDYVFNRAGVGYNFRNKTVGLTANVAYQRASLTSDQRFPLPGVINTNYNNLLPSLQLDYRFTDNSRLRLLYRTNTAAPSVSQLQNVVDNTNPLLLTTGNPNLQQSYSHNVSARYTLTTPEKASSFFALLSAGVTNNAIANSIEVGTGDSTGAGPLLNGVPLAPGVQLTRPVNLPGAWNARSLLTYGTPLGLLKTNLNLNVGLNYNRAPGLINNELNYVHNYTLSQGVVLSSNISTKLDFTLSYGFNYNWVNNTIRPTLNNNYITQTAGARLNWQFGKGWLLQTDLNHQDYRGLSATFNQSYTIWNASFGKKVLPDQRGELKLTVFDLLNQNNSISRNVTDTYFEDTQSLALRQYGMLTFTYKLNK